MRLALWLLLTSTTLMCGLSAGAIDRQPARPGDPAVPNAVELYLPLVAGGRTSSPPQIHRFEAEPATIAPGETATLSWQVTGATAVSISPGVGDVGGTAVTVTAATTTGYTLLATNAGGTASAQVTVTVASAPASVPDGFFIVPHPDIEVPTAHPTARVDGKGGVHVVFTPQSASQSDPVRRAYYAYCPANCQRAEAFTILPLGEGVDNASLALDPAGRPRLLLRLPAQSGSVYLFQYWMCDAGCLELNHWRSGDIGYTYARQVGWVESFTRAFALDPEGRPRFVYYDNGADHEDPHRGVFYAYCDAECLDAAQWYAVQLFEDAHAQEFALAFDPGGQPRLAYATYDGEALTQPVAYAECLQACHLAASWSRSVLVETVSASVTHFALFALQIDGQGRPRLALYTGTGTGGNLTAGQLYYLTCDAGMCSQPAAWSALNLALPATHGEEGVDLALDGTGRPRIAYHAPMGAGFGLYYAWCDAACATDAAGWQVQKLEASETVNGELPIPPWPGCAFPQCNPPIPPCTLSTWDSGVRPSLALDAAGNPAIAYDANHEQGGGCGTFTDTKLTRFLWANHP